LGSTEKKEKGGILSREATRIYKLDIQTRKKNLFEIIKKSFNFDGKKVFLIVDTSAISLQSDFGLANNDGLVNIFIVNNIASLWDASTDLSSAIELDANNTSGFDYTGIVNNIDDTKDEVSALVGLSQLKLQRDGDHDNVIINNQLTKPIHSISTDVNMLSNYVKAKSQDSKTKSVPKYLGSLDENAFLDLKRTGDAMQARLALNLHKARYDENNKPKDNDNLFVFVTLDHLAFLKARLQGVPSIFTRIDSNTHERIMVFYRPPELRNPPVIDITKTFTDLNNKAEELNGLFNSKRNAFMTAAMEFMNSVIGEDEHKSFLEETQPFLGSQQPAQPAPASGPKQEGIFTKLIKFFSRFVNATKIQEEKTSNDGEVTSLPKTIDNGVFKDVFTQFRNKINEASIDIEELNKLIKLDITDKNLDHIFDITTDHETIQGLLEPYQKFQELKARIKKVLTYTFVIEVYYNICRLNSIYLDETIEIDYTNIFKDYNKDLLNDNDRTTIIPQLKEFLGKYEFLNNSNDDILVHKQAYEHIIKVINHDITREIYKAPKKEYKVVSSNYSSLSDAGGLLAIFDSNKGNIKFYTEDKDKFEKASQNNENVRKPRAIDGFQTNLQKLIDLNIIQRTNDTLSDFQKQRMSVLHYKDLPSADKVDYKGIIKRVLSQQGGQGESDEGDESDNGHITKKQRTNSGINPNLLQASQDPSLGASQMEVEQQDVISTFIDDKLFINAFDNTLRNKYNEESIEYNEFVKKYLIDEYDYVDDEYIDYYKQYVTSYETEIIDDIEYSIEILSAIPTEINTYQYNDNIFSPEFNDVSTVLNDTFDSSLQNYISETNKLNDYFITDGGLDKYFQLNIALISAACDGPFITSQANPMVLDGGASKGSTKPNVLWTLRQYHAKYFPAYEKLYYGALKKLFHQK